MTRTGRQHATSGTLGRASDAICGVVARSLMVRSAEVHRRVRSATRCTPSTGWRVAARILVAQDAPSQAPGRLPSSRLTATRARPDLQWEGVGRGVSRKAVQLAAAAGCQGRGGATELR
jgi:hypothetical protein